MMKIAAVIVVGVALAGCATAPNLQQAQYSFRAEQSACEAARQRGDFKTYSERARCVNIAADRTLRPASPYPDLINMGQAQNLSIAAAVDAKRITPSEGDAQLAVVFAKLDAEGSRRSAGQAVVNQQALIAGAQTMAGPPIVRLQTHCTQFMGTVTCN